MCDVTVAILLDDVTEDRFRFFHVTSTVQPARRLGQNPTISIKFLQHLYKALEFIIKQNVLDPVEANEARKRADERQGSPFAEEIAKNSEQRDAETEAGRNEDAWREEV